MPSSSGSSPGSNVKSAAIPCRSWSARVAMSQRTPLPPRSPGTTSTSPAYVPRASKAASTEFFTWFCDAASIRISTNCWLGSPATLVATSSITATWKAAVAARGATATRAVARAAARVAGRNKLSQARFSRPTTLRHRDDAHAAGLRRAADVVAERDGGVLHLPPLGLALELLVVLVDHADPGGARRVTEGLETAVGVDRQLAVERERAAADVLLGRALLAEAEVLVGEQFGQGEAVVHLGDVDLLPRIRDPGLRVRLPGGVLGRLSAQEVEVRVLLRVGRERDRDGAHEDEVVAMPLRQLAPGEDRRRGTVGLRGAVVEAEGPRDHARAERFLDGDLALQHRLRRERAVVVVLHRDAGQVR